MQQNSVVSQDLLSLYRIKNCSENMTEKQKILRDIKRYNLHDPKNFENYIIRMKEKINKKPRVCKQKK